MVLIGLVLAATSLAADPAADFARYPVAVARHLRAVPPRLADARARRYRTELRAAARRRPDFAGHWVLASIGCGASCVQPAAVDRLSGRVVWFPATVCCWPLAVSEPLAHRADSRLLSFEGQLDEHEPGGVHAYLFDGRRFVASTR